MKKIKLLDCTLRDGGYINDWKFGQKNIFETVKCLENCGVDILELGFIKGNETNPDRTIFTSVEQVSSFIPNKKPGIEYSVMMEAVRPFPLEKLAPRSESTFDTIRVMIWKDMHDENNNVVDALHSGLEYCKGLKEKGYDIFVQPTRVDQYSDEEFINMLKLFSELSPTALYIVDSWGTMYSDKLLHYLKLADKYLDKDVQIGYHGHNNMMQAFSNAVDFINSGVDRTLVIDSSVYGIGRGAGNLNTELIAKYLNEFHDTHYEVEPLLKIYNDCVKDIYNIMPWGYSVAYFLSAYYHCNPQYGTYYGITHKIPETDMAEILKTIPEEDKVLYTAQKAEDYKNAYYKNR